MRGLRLLRVGIVLFVLLLLPLLSGCGSKAAPAQADGKDRITKLFNLYRAYVDKHRKGPPDELALRDFGAKLTSAERSDRLIGDDLESIFTSPRDNKKFVVRYKTRIDPSQNKAVIWEESGVGGNRLVALSIGYVVEYDETTLKDYQK